jgi:hypothetical protein
MRRHTVARLDPERLRSSAEDRGRVVLPLRGQATEVELRPTPVFERGTEAVVLELDGSESRSPVTDIVTYAGSVPGRERGEARLTLTGRTLTGYVRLDDDWLFIDPMRRFRRGADRDEFVVYGKRDLAFVRPAGMDFDTAGFIEVEDGPVHSVGPEIGIALWADPEYEAWAGILGMQWTEAQAALFNNLNGVYQRELDREFRIRRAFLDRTDELSSDDASTLLDQFGRRARDVVGDLRQVAVRERTGIEIAHLTTARNLDGDTIGIAWVPGVWSLTQHRGYTWIFDMSYENMLVAAHELGHNFDGVHGEADEFCVTEFIICLDYERTIMWPTIYSDTRDEFSGENNRRIRQNMATGRNVDFTHG